MALQWNQLVECCKPYDLKAMTQLMAMHTNPDSGTLEEMHPFAFVANANSPDTLTWDDAMNGPDCEGYLEAAKKELDTLALNKDAWDVVDRQPWMNVLPSTWAFRCKRFPNGYICKLKAHFCARGDRQVEGVDFFDTFAPVVNWMTV